MRRMNEKSIEDLLERVKSWPAGAQRDLAQAVLSIEANLERGAYDEPYEPTPEEREVLGQALEQADAGSFTPSEPAPISTLFSPNCNFRIRLQLSYSQSASMLRSLVW
jgi:hypothetical protein